MSDTRQTLGKDLLKGDLITRRIGSTFKLLAITHPDATHLLLSVVREGRPSREAIVVKSHIHEIHNVTREVW